MAALLGLEDLRDLYYTRFSIINFNTFNVISILGYFKAFEFQKSGNYVPDCLKFSCILQSYYNIHPMLSSRIARLRENASCGCILCGNDSKLQYFSIYF